MTENAKKLIEALRSGRYEQGQDALRPMPDTYCCLGVACDISGLGEWTDDGEYKVDTFDSDGSLLPTAVRDWLGFYSNSGYFRSVASDPAAASLSGRNDSGYSFAEIADLIESEPEGLFA